jgi:hypothetical protein
MPSPPPTPAPHSDEKKIDWETAKVCLAELQRHAPSILQQAIIIGGIACWFYRQLLAKAQDGDFKVPDLSPQQELLWLSKDRDFTNFFAQDARELLKEHIVTDARGRRQIKLAGVPIGFAQVGVTFEPEAAWAETWIGTFKWNDTLVQCRILDPITLYREKQALSQKRGYESDRLHFELLSEFLRYETCRQADALASTDALDVKTDALKFLLAVHDRAVEVCRDSRVCKRIKKIILNGTSLTPAEEKLLGALSSQNNPG